MTFPSQLSPRQKKKLGICILLEPESKAPSAASAFSQGTVPIRQTYSEWLGRAMTFKKCTAGAATCQRTGEGYSVLLREWCSSHNPSEGPPTRIQMGRAAGGRQLKRKLSFFFIEDKMNQSLHWTLSSWLLTGDENLCGAFSDFKYLPWPPASEDLRLLISIKFF